VVTDKKIRIRIRKSCVRIQGSGSVPICHGSGTQLLNVDDDLPSLWVGPIRVVDRNGCLLQILLIATGLGSISASSETVESEGRLLGRKNS
jgi:hypothetical protein